MTALMRRTPAEDDSSFLILKEPSSFVFSTCGPQQISFETSPIVYSETWSPYFAPNSATAPSAFASSTVVSFFVTLMPWSIHSLTVF